MKGLLKHWLNRMGWILVRTSNFGVSPEVDMRRWTAGNPVRTVLDVGANIGQSTESFLRTFPNAQIHAFEPVEANLAALRARFGQHPRVHIHPHALGARRGEIEMGLARHAGGHSVLLAADATDKVSVPLETLDQVCRDNSLERIDLLKPDVEGFELSVLQGGAELLQGNRIRMILAECVFRHQCHTPHTSFFDLEAFLDPLGFSLFACYSEWFNLRHGASIGNVLFVHRDHLPDRVPGRHPTIA